MITTEQRRKAETAVSDYLALRKLCDGIEGTNNAKAIFILDQIHAEDRDSWKESTGDLYKFLPVVCNETECDPETLQQIRDEFKAKYTG